jgi:conjugative transfer signal peptidase TraF
MLKRRSIVLSLGAVGVASLMLAEAAWMPVRIVYNPSPSAPKGLYSVADPRPLRHGDLVLVALPERWQAWAVGRSYIGREVPLIKRVVALSGDRVCAVDGGVYVNGTRRAAALDRDGSGRPMPVWRGCRGLREGEVFALMTDAPASLDGRYFGPLDIDRVVGKLTPLWLSPSGTFRDVE